MRPTLVDSNNPPPQPKPVPTAPNVVRNSLPNFGHDIDETLELAKGQLADGIIIGWDQNNRLRWFVSRDLEPRDTLWIIENFKLSFLDRPPLQIDEDD